MSIVNLSIAEVLEILIQGAWRRRWIIVAPIVIFSMLAVVVLLTWPRNYSARALLMLQESGSADPLMGGGGRQSRLKAEEIDTLLKSDRVLADALLDMNVGRKPLTASDLEGNIKSLKRRLFVGVVGNEFIEISLNDTDREGIGDRLSIIMTSFFERLLARENTMKTAREFALEQRQRDVATTSAAVDAWIARARSAGARDELPPTEMDALHKRQASLETTVAASAQALLHAGFNMATLEQAITEELRSFSRSKDAEEFGTLSERLGQLKELESRLAEYRAVGLEIANLKLGSARRMAASLDQVKGNPQDPPELLKSELALIESRYAESVDQLAKHVKLAKRGTGPSLTPLGLIAPDSIRIIDEPRDPETPTTSILKILLACIAAGLGMGGGLAVLAEQLDDRIYDRRNLASLTGIDVIYRVPAFGMEHDTPAKTDAEADTPSDGIAATRGRLAKLVPKKQSEGTGRDKQIGKTA